MTQQREVALVVNSIVGLVEIGLIWLIASGVELTGRELMPLAGFIITIGVIVSSLLIRSRVTPLIDPRDNHDRRLHPTTVEPKVVDNGITQVAIL
jgi:hypothetical protein